MFFKLCVNVHVGQGMFKCRVPSIGTANGVCICPFEELSFDSCSECHSTVKSVHGGNEATLNFVCNFRLNDAGVVDVILFFSGKYLESMRENWLWREFSVQRR